MRITLSGVKRRFEPSMWLRNSTPSSLDRSQRREREHLEAARVREDRPVPLHELVQSAELAHELVAGTQVQVIRVGEDHLRVHRAEVGGVERLDGGERAHRHERGRLDGAVRRARTARRARRRTSSRV